MTYSDNEKDYVDERNYIDIKTMGTKNVRLNVYIFWLNISMCEV